MNIYRISQEINNDYETYDSAVVIAANELEAKNIRPDGDPLKPASLYDAWVGDVDQVKCELIGVADEKRIINDRVVVASFNAG